MGVLPPLALLFFLVGFSRGSVFCLRHPGMIAPIPSGEQPLGFEVGEAGTAACWSRASQGLRLAETSVGQLVQLGGWLRSETSQTAKPIKTTKVTTNLARRLSLMFLPLRSGQKIQDAIS